MQGVVHGVDGSDRRRLRDGDRDTDDEQSRLNRLEEQLDQCRDLLRQRRAKREFGENPDDASVRSTDTVEHDRR